MSEHNGPPPEIEAIASRVAKEELKDSEDAYARQIAGHVGALILQEAWPAIEAHFATLPKETPK